MKKTIRSKLVGKIPDDLFTQVPTSFDILGSKGDAVAIIEIPEELEDYETSIGEAIQEVHHNVNSVLAKSSERYGEYRLREMRLLVGDENTEVIHKESGCRFKLDPRLTYFSVRESTERERIISQISAPENVLVLFSGIGPFPICIAKHRPQVSATAVELNPDAHRYCLENIKLNKVDGRVDAILGDVRKICPTLEHQYDRVLTPLPKGAYMFLDVIIPTIKPRGVLHQYHWASDEDPYSEAYRYVEEAASGLGRKTEFIQGVKVSKYSPRVSKVRIDVMVY